ncbi:MAG: TonB-dependent receptor, partial [Acidobacteria bacterium]|nr:TonB-dependent receptor [Acidobacteriota bacterium]
QEQSVVTGGIPAKFIGAPGLVSSVITKSGGNEFHGSLNYFFQNDSLQQDNEHAESSIFSAYDAAFTLGGPILRDKLWFFASYRVLNRDEDVSALDTGQYMRTVNTSSDQAFAKVSWSPTSPIKITGTYLTDPMDKDGSNERDVLNNRDLTRETGGDRYILNYSQVLGPAYLSLSGGMHNGELSEYAASQDTYNQVYFNSVDPFTSADEQLGGDGANILDQRDTTFAKGSFEWYIGSSWGDHTLSFGAEYMDHERLRDLTYTGDDPPANWSSYHSQYAGVTAGGLRQGDWTGSQWEFDNPSDYTGLINAIDASPNSAQHYAILDLNGDGTISEAEMATLVFDSTTGNPDGMLNYYRIVEIEAIPISFNSKGSIFFAQDSWQLKNFTVNVGARAEQWDHYGSNGSKVSEFDLAVAPRLGAVWDITGKGKMKLSAFYGRYYDPIRMNMTAFAGTLVGSEREEQIYTNFEWLTYRIRGGSRTVDAAFAPSTKTPYTDDFQVGFEVDLGANMSVEALVIRRKTRDILEDYDLCLYAYCPDGTQVYGDIDAENSMWLGFDYFGYEENPGSNFVIATLNGAKRNWDGIELVFRKRFSNRWQGLASYTYADAMGSSNSDSNADFQGDVVWLDPAAPNQWARQPGMIENLAKAGGSYTFDFGLELGGTVAYSSGTVASRTFESYRRNLPMREDDSYTFGGHTTRWLGEDSVGGLENPSWTTIDFRGSYTFNLGRSMSLELFLDVFNVLDDQAAVRNQDVVAGTGGIDFGEPLQWNSPRRLYLGGRLAF